MQESELCLTELTSIARVTVCCRTNDPGRPFLTPPAKEERVLSNCPLVYWPEKVSVPAATRILVNLAFTLDGLTVLSPLLQGAFQLSLMVLVG